MVLHIETYKKGSLPSLEKKHGLDGKPLENAIAMPLLAPPRETLLKSVFYRVAQRNNPEQSLRRDAVLLCEATLSGCDALLPRMGREENLLRFFKSAAAYLQRRFLPENCMYAVMYIEASPCMCFGFVPITEEGRLSASRMLGKSRISALQTELWVHLAQCGYSIEAQREPQTAAIPGNAAIEALRESVRALERSKRELEQEFRILEQQKELEEEILSLQRENQNLRLEKIMLSRQIERYMEVLSANPELEQQFTTQLQLMKCMKSHTKKRAPAS